MHQLVRAVFARLHELDPDEEEQKLADTGDFEGGEMKMSVSTSGPSLQAQKSDSPAEQDAVAQDNGESQVAEVSPPPPPPEQVEEQAPETPGVPRLPCRCSGGLRDQF